jgi:hypothetical protein
MSILTRGLGLGPGRSTIISEIEVDITDEELELEMADPPIEIELLDGTITINEEI